MAHFSIELKSDDKVRGPVESRYFRELDLTPRLFIYVGSQDHAPNLSVDIEPGNIAAVQQFAEALMNGVAMVREEVARRAASTAVMA